MVFPKLCVDFVAYLGVRLVATVAEVLSAESVRALAKFLSWLAADVLKIRRRVIVENLGYAFPAVTAAERQQLVRKMWEHLFLLAYEILLTPRKIHETNWRKFVRLCKHEGPLLDILRGRPLVLVTGHFGNFEIGGYVLALLGVPLYSVARPIDNPFLDRFLTRLRTAGGQMLIPKLGATEAVDQVAKEGKTVAFLADQSAGPKGCFVDFFGRKASTFKAVALVSLVHQAPIVVCYARRRERVFQFDLEVLGVFDPLRDSHVSADVPSITQWFTTVLEEEIRQHPEQYWWLHRRWKEQPPLRRKELAELPSAKQAA
ncbi:MAG: lysophospholipid acyltransferase family protein [Thermoguttaceae bacterium]|nr:lysophospholipid acyltransferase family protein [Thermoguttaceae bacterium]MDW8078016.1 lysophospholipid acyltransferase family protein [Thermoguttaceae bacterium]